MAGYAVIRNAEVGQSLGISILMLVDRTKSKARWWTSDEPNLAIRYRSEDAARFAARRLRFGGVRVVDFDEAARQIQRQDREILPERAMSDTEQGWDGHKEMY